jgi:hypothetical protein
MLCVCDRCLTADPNGRPDVISLSGHIADVVLSHYDACQRKLETTEKNLDKERRRMQRYALTLYNCSLTLGQIRWCTYTMQPHTCAMQ